MSRDTYCNFIPAVTYASMCNQVIHGELDAQWAADKFFDAYAYGEISWEEYEDFVLRIGDYF